MQSSHVPATADLPSEYRGQTPAHLASSAFGMLPDNTMAAVVAKSALHIAEATDAVAILREYGEAFSRYNIALGSGNTARLLEPTSWSQLGIDVGAPIGAAFMVEKRAVGLFFASLTRCPWRKC
ncbi:MAG: hypothetical protein GY811_11560 [Myxococcales bacterium]|nr:hypothetical protein [Myxococcales bacterium]